MLMKWRGVEVTGVSGGQLSHGERGGIERKSGRTPKGEVGGKHIREVGVSNPKESPC
jgi:hypothetical protein